ncbi:MAG: hypothetical protein HQL98_01025 [Magnetococcales bacterium]|nr:hypothetical protein [Magnetococcales bacterium]
MFVPEKKENGQRIQPTTPTPAGTFTNRSGPILAKKSRSLEIVKKIGHFVVVANRFLMPRCPSTHTRDLFHAEFPDRLEWDNLLL